jgi:beta-glucosidase
MPRPAAEIDALLAQLTIEELAGLLGGSDVWHTTGVPRLGVPTMRVTDGPAGARGTSFSGIASVNVPCGTALAATFDPTLVEEIGHLLGLETRAKGARVLLAPTINLHRTPIGGRNFECMSEDPYLTGRTAVAYVKGLQAEGVAACAKHFVGNDTEFERMTIDSQISEATLRELYLAPFEAIVKEAGVMAIMTAYNKVNGPHAADSKELITDILRDEWGFDGIVMSDWFGLHSTVEGVQSGLDLEMPGPPLHRGSLLVDAVTDGRLTRADLEPAGRRMLTFLDRIGAWDDGGPSAETTRDVPSDRVLLRSAAAATMTLLRNENTTLPLDSKAPGRVALIGPNANPGQIMGGGSAFVNAVHWSSPVNALKERLGSAVTYAQGCAIHRVLPAPSRDLLGPITFDYYADRLHAYHAGEAPVHSEAGQGFKVLWMYPPAPNVPIESFGCVMRSTFTPDISGEWTFGTSSAGDSRLLIDGEVIVDDVDAPMGGSFFGLGKFEHKRAVNLVAGQTYQFVVEFARNDGMFGAINVGALAPIVGNPFIDAVDLAAHSDVSIVVVGTNDDWESEGYDRAVLDLPGEQDHLISEVAAVSKKTIVIINAGSPVTMPWLNQVDAVIYTWFPGQEFGDALADVLFGDVEPGGRLPVTMPRSLEITPAGEHYPGRNGIAQYREGRLMGYRWYDTIGREPLFPFGFGLGYSTTNIVSAQHAHSNAAAVECTVANTGSRPTRETVQVYAHVTRAEGAPGDQPVQKLVGFIRTPTIAPGSSVTVSVQIDERAFMGWDEKTHAWATLDGAKELRVGLHSRHVAHTIAVP